MRKRTGKLPHRPFRHIPMHIVYRLNGSLPRVIIEQLRQERARLRSECGPSAAGKTLAEEQFETSLDDALHGQSNGPYHLANPRLASLVLESWQFVAERHTLQLYAVCVMSNHVHVLARSRSGQDIDAGLVMQQHKSYTASEANKLLGLVGQSFWATSYFDRDVRNGTFDTVMWYVLNNPVSCGLVAHWEDWPWTYLNPEFDLLYRRQG